MIPPETKKQIDRLSLKGGRPLIVCDVDEVVVHFLRAFEAWLEEHDCRLDPASFALNGNVRRRASGQALTTEELGEMLAAFFTARTAEFEAIEGASRALEELSAVADIVMLTNLPQAYYADRQRNLLGHGMPYPVVVNEGHKGPAMREFVAICRSPIVFLDDTPGNVTSVIEAVPKAHVIHFMQDERFGRHCPLIDGISLRSDNWNETADHIAGLLERGE